MINDDYENTRLKWPYKLSKRSNTYRGIVPNLRHVTDSLILRNGGFPSVQVIRNSVYSSPELRLIVWWSHTAKSIGTGTVRGHGVHSNVELLKFGVNSFVNFEFNATLSSGQVVTVLLAQFLICFLLQYEQQ